MRFNFKKFIRKLIWLGFLVFVSYMCLYRDERKGVENIIKRSFNGIIEDIDKQGRTIYFIVDGQRLSFGRRTGHSLGDVAQNGDSLIKYQDSTYILLIKRKKGNEEPLKKRFEIF